MKKYFDFSRIAFIVIAMVVSLSFVSCGVDDDDDEKIGGVGKGNIQWLDKSMNFSYAVCMLDNDSDSDFKYYTYVLSDKPFRSYSIGGYDVVMASEGSSTIAIRVLATLMADNKFPTGEIPSDSYTSEPHQTYWLDMDIDLNYNLFKQADETGLKPEYSYGFYNNDRPQLFITDLGGGKYKILLSGSSRYNLEHDGQNTQGTATYNVLYEGGIKLVKMPEGLGY